MSPNNNYNYSSIRDLDGGLPRIRRRNASVDSSGEARKRRRGSPGGGWRMGRGSDYEPSVPRRSSYGGGGAGSRDGGYGRDYNTHANNNVNCHSYGNGFSVSSPPPPAGPYSSAPGYARPPPPVNTNVMSSPRGMPFGSKSRRLYVGNLPFNVGLTEQALVQFFSAMYIAAFRAQNSPSEALPCGSVWLRSDGNFGFIELRGDQEAVNMMQLNGTFLHGRPLRINRPSDYTANYNSELPPEGVNVLAVEKLCAQLEGIVAPPADLRANHPNFAADKEKEQATVTPTIPVLSAMPNGMSNNTLGKPEIKPAVNAVQKDTLPVLQSRAAIPIPISIPKSEPKRTININNTTTTNGHAIGNVNVNQESKSEGEASVESKSDRVSAEDKPETAVYGNVISLVNLVTDKDLDGTREEYDDLVDDVKTECGQYGTVVALEIPRNGPWRSTAFVEYAQKEHALAAVNALRARVFEGMKIAAKVVTECKTAKDAVTRTK